MSLQCQREVDCPKCGREAGQRCVFVNSGHEAPDGYVHNERAMAAVESLSRKSRAAKKEQRP